MAKAKPAPDAEESAPRRDTKKIGLIAVVVLAVAAGAYFKVLKPAPVAEAAGPPPPPAEGEIVEVGQLTVNLASPNLHYARVGFSAVLAEGTSSDVVKPRLPLLQDAAITEIGRSTPESLRTPEGVDDLRARLTARAQAIYPPQTDGAQSQVLRVVLTELVVQ